MQRVERHIKIGDRQLEDICFKAARLYNFCNYHLRQAFFGNMQKVSEYEMSGILSEFQQPDYTALPAQTSQQIIKLVFQNWKAFYKSLKDYKKNPSKYKAKPRIPKYKKKNGLGAAVLTGQQVKIKEGYIHFPKKADITPLKTKVDNVKQVRIVPKATCFVIEVVHERKEVAYDLDENLYLSIDLGINNLVTAIDNAGNRPFIVNGKPLKAMNQYYNKQQAKLKSHVGDKGTSNRLKRLLHKRSCKIEDYLHKTSRTVINYCLNHRIKTIVIGRNKDWKQGINIGKKNNQTFVSIPFFHLISMITYKAEECGMQVVEQEENHTSKCDALAMEKICHHERYKGKRAKRGLFKSSTGRLINSDVNGALNIGRKANVFQEALINRILDRGITDMPVRITPDKFLNHCSPINR